ncbi:hypothetical protein WICPIJ_010068 [Wickerhamomyces pijperi]|uniref:Uncharacterized protein n=1 Tax=Wickerhamomyces pijperi TaxID=599730 RepID=A0A9P8TBJ1_WICPI|nr:hypothetical protein WICPIJ_010068 [Wickerhamomyces pijperi]
MSVVLLKDEEGEEIEGSEIEEEIMNAGIESNEEIVLLELDSGSLPADEEVEEEDLAVAVFVDEAGRCSTGGYRLVCCCVDGTNCCCCA